MERIARELIPADLLSVEEIAALLPDLDEIISWAKGIQAAALQLALSGTDVPGYKVIEGRTSRAYSVDEVELSSVAEAAGIDSSIIYERKLLTPAQLEKAVGKKTYNTTFSGCVEVLAGKPALVPISDSRAAFSAENARNEFKEELNK